MSKLLKALFLSFILLAINLSYAASNDNTPLWGTTYYGMSVNEVLNSVIGAHNITAADNAPFTTALVKIDKIEIAGEQFNVWFIFESNKLNQVTLRLISNGTAVQSDANLIMLYARYARLLSLKYGKPISATEQVIIPPDLPSGHMQWISGLTNIDLTLNKSHLDISYAGQYANDLKNL